MKSILQDIQNISGKASLKDGLLAIGLVKDPSKPFNIDIINDWYQGGAETYICQFSCYTDTMHQYILKACVVMSFGSSISNIVDEWIKKRTIVSSFISTPKIFGYAKGTILEEYIPFKWTGQFQRMTFDEQDAAIKNLATICLKLDKLGFAPIGIVSDLRSRGKDIVMIDFGEDLGQPSESSKNNSQIYISELERRRDVFSLEHINLFKKFLQEQL